jgi:hypothetical protein
MPPRKPFRKRREPEDYQRRGWLPRGVSITVYDIQGTAISEELANSIVSLVEAEVKKANAPALAIDVRKS